VRSFGVEFFARFRPCVRLHWSQNRQNTANQHLSGYSQTLVATFNPTCVSILIATQGLLVLRLESYAHCSRYLTRLSARNKLTLLAQDGRGRSHSSRIVFSVAADINSNVFDFYSLVWSLSWLLCCVVSGSKLAVPLDRAATGIGKIQNHWL